MADLHVTTDGPVVRITLDRPERRNALDGELVAALTAAVRNASDAAGARCVVLGGAGDAFSAGADAGWMRASLELSEEENEAEALRLADLFASFTACPLPVIARVHGPALGGGAGLVCSVDLAVMADDAEVGFPEVRLGIVPATIAPYVVRRIGAGAARALFLRGRPIGAADALRLGLVDVVVPATELDAAIDALVDDLVAGGPEALAAAKRLLDDVATLPPREARATTARRIAAIRRGDEAQAGLRAFLARERPPWR